MTRAALYVRVSTEEQALHGFSIETQIDNLKSFCERQQMKIVDIYADEGISGGKSPTKRPALKRLLDDVRADKVDLILFTKLDRWFRSVIEYFKVQEILDKKKVGWKAIHEDYDTTTANGRMAITIFLAIAQNEREKTSERIKVVFDHKRKNKEVCFGMPNRIWGYKVSLDDKGVKRLVKDPEEQPFVQAYWDLLVKHQSISFAIREMVAKYGITRSENQWRNTVKNPFYCGRCKDVEDFCEPYVSVEDWEKLNSRRALFRKTGQQRVYIFTGLIRCDKCGRTLAGHSVPQHYKERHSVYLSYACWNVNSTCKGSMTISEIKLEKFLLNHLRSLISLEIEKVEVEQKASKPKPKVSTAPLKERLRRLNNAYFAGNMTDEEYAQQAATIKAAIAAAEQQQQDEPPVRDLSGLTELLSTDFESIYASFNAEEKRRFWHGIIKEIKLHRGSDPEVIFL